MTVQNPLTDDIQMDNEKRELVKSCLLYLQVSTMDTKEKAFWTIFLPLMEMQDIRDLEAILKEEADKLTELYLQNRMHMNTDFMNQS